MTAPASRISPELPSAIDCRIGKAGAGPAKDAHVGSGQQDGARERARQQTPAPEPPRRAAFLLDRRSARHRRRRALDAHQFRRARRGAEPAFRRVPALEAARHRRAFADSRRRDRRQLAGQARPLALAARQARPDDREDQPSRRGRGRARPAALRSRRSRRRCEPRQGHARPAGGAGRILHERRQCAAA